MGTLSICGIKVSWMGRGWSETKTVKRRFRGDGRAVKGREALVCCKGASSSQTRRLGAGETPAQRRGQLAAGSSAQAKPHRLAGSDVPWLPLPIGCPTLGQGANSCRQEHILRASGPTKPHSVVDFPEVFGWQVGRSDSAHIRDSAHPVISGGVWAPGQHWFCSGLFAFPSTLAPCYSGGHSPIFTFPGKCIFYPPIFDSSSWGKGTCHSFLAWFPFSSRETGPQSLNPLWLLTSPWIFPDSPFPTQFSFIARPCLHQLLPRWGDCLFKLSFGWGGEVGAGQYRDHLGGCGKAAVAGCCQHHGDCLACFLETVHCHLALHN